MSNSQYYTAAKIFTGESWLSLHAIEVSEGRIQSVKPVSELSSTRAVRAFDGCSIVPAFIDLQIYGAYGKLLAVYPEADSLHKLVEYCRKGGASYCLPTVATNTKDVIYSCIDVTRQFQKSNGSEILGLHIEGPWLNPIRRGAHIESLIHSPSLEEARELLEYGKGVIKMITLAPEACSGELIDLILSYGVIISAGHSNAGYAEAKAGFERGIQCATHLFNAMSPMHHREPGLPGAIMDDPKVMASIIPDGYHVDFAMIRIAKKVMKERLFAITDAVTETGRGYYPHQLAGDKYESSGILSGSALNMNTALRNLVEKVQIDTGEAIRMCSLYPARVMGMDKEAGMILPGYICKLLVLDEKLDIVETIF